MRAAIYARLSVSRGDEGLGVKRQEADARALAARNGWDVMAVFVDDGKSAWHENSRRPGYEALCEGIRRHDFDFVIVYETDRLARRLRNLLDLMDLLIESGVTVHSVKSGAMNLASPKDITFAQMGGVIAEAYVNDARDKNKRARLEIARSGGRHVTSRPYGWESGGLIVRRGEARIVQEIVTRIINGESCTRIASDLNGRGVPTVNGKQWTGIGVKKTALRPSNAAIREHLGAYYDGNWEPIITRQELDEVKRTLSQPRTMYRRTAGRKHLLSGFVFCGICGNKLGVGAGRSNVKPAYRCDGMKSHQPERVGCGKISRQSLPLEHLVTEAVLYRLDSQSLLEAVNQAQDSSDEMMSLLTQAADQRKVVDGLVDDYASGLLSREQFARAKLTAETKLHDLERQIQSQSYNKTLSSIDLTKSLRETWETADLSWRRGLLDLLIERIVLLPMPKSGFRVKLYEVDGTRYRFDPELVEIEWRA